jgi:hypothetical protein
MSVADKKGARLFRSIRLFVRGKEFPNQLMQSGMTADKNSYIMVGEPVAMIYDHRDLVALQVVSVLGEFFVLQEEYDVAIQEKAGVHPSHNTRYSDASSFDEICENCGATDDVMSGPGALMYPCRNPEGKKK